MNAVLSGEADEGAVSRAAALGWNSPEHVCVVLGTAPDGDSELTVEAIRRASRHAKVQVLTGVLGDRLVVIAGGSDNPLAVAKSLIGPFAAGPVVAGPVVPDLLAATRSAQAAAAGLKACSAWQDAPRPVLADDLLPERAIAGDPSAREQLVEEIYRPLEEAGSALLETLSVYLEQASSLEGAARMLFVHPNTVRYRLRRVTDVTGWSPWMYDPRSHYGSRSSWGVWPTQIPRHRVLSEAHKSPSCSSSLSSRAAVPVPKRECESARTRRSRPGRSDARLP